MPTFLLLLSLAAPAADPAAPAATSNAVVNAEPAAAPPAATPEQIATAIDHGLEYLRDESNRWIAARKCASCHHAPMMVWAYGEAKRRGFKIDEEALATALDYTLAEDNRSGVFAKETMNPEFGKLSFATVFMANSLRAIELTKPEHIAGADRLWKHLKEVQDPDGSWPPAVAGRFPIFERGEVGTLLVALAATQPARPAATDAEPAKLRAALLEPAKKYLAGGERNRTHQSLALRLTVMANIDPTSEDTARLAAELIAQQQPSGGWTQIKEMDPDALATGQSLYALSFVPNADRASIARGQAFLVAQQLPAGSWPMQSRSTEPGTVSHNLDPITCAAAGWATLGLVSTSPAPKDLARKQ
ncbi:MAG TPA: hypothetical protein VGJ26_15585 [Pirellulales bacterium]|jgi:cytochrome c553